MASYTSKPTTIHAFQFGVDQPPQWYLRAIDTALVRESRDLTGLTATIHTLEGTMVAVAADKPYIVLGTEGELYPVKASIFEAKYVKDEVQVPPLDAVTNQSGWSRRLGQ